MKKLVRLVVWLVVIAMLVIGGLRLRAMFERPPAVAVALVRSETVTRVLALTGRIRPVHTNRITPLVAGRLVLLTREEGAAVEAGEILARLDDATVAAAEAQTRADVARERDEQQQRVRDAARARDLAAAGLIAANEVETADLAVATGEKRLARLREQRTELAARRAEYVLRAPLSGYVLERPVDPGQVVSTLDVLYEIATAERAEVEVEVDERFFAELAIGMPAVVAPLSGRAESYDTRVIYIGRRIDRLSGAAVVRLAFESEAPDFPVGLSLDVNLLVERHPDVLTVPRAAVASLDAQPWVLTVEDGRTVRRAVSVVDWPAARLVMVAGPEAGAQVVLEPRAIGADVAVRTDSSESDD